MRGRSRWSVGIATFVVLVAGAMPSAHARVAEKPCKGVVGQWCEESTTLGDLLPCKPVRARGEPLLLGMVNTETAPTGAFPELTLAVEAGITWINRELGGVGGRPLSLVTCDTKFSPEGSQACAQQMVDEGVVAVLGGIDIFSTGMAILEQNEIPYIGGIPAAFEQVKSPVSFQFSGGTWGAGVAFAHYAVDVLGAKRIGIMYGDFGSIKSAAVDYSAKVAEALGADEVTVVPFPITATDFIAPLTAANEGSPDAIFVFAADAACVPVMKATQDLGISAQLFLTGACAAPKTTTTAGASAVGTLFNVEGPVVGSGDADTSMYFDVIDEYGKGLDAAGAGTVSFRSLMNLWLVLSDLGPDATRAAILEQLRTAVDAPSFMGHPYTCDGQQIPEFPALCAAQQVIAEFTAKGLRQAGKGQKKTKWIDVAAIVDATL